MIIMSKKLFLWPLSLSCSRRPLLTIHPNYIYLYPFVPDYLIITNHHFSLLTIGLNFHQRSTQQNLECKLIYTIGVFQDISKRIRELSWIEKDVVASTEAQERCTMQFVQIVASRPRFPSSPTGPGQCIAAIATRSTGHPEEASKEINPKIFF